MFDSESISVPPFMNQCETLFQDLSKLHRNSDSRFVAKECDLPLIDLGCLNGGEEIRIKECKVAISKAAVEWGVFQVLNHGVSENLLKKMNTEQKKVLQMSFEKKNNLRGHTMSRCYKWGNPWATSLKQFSWCEAYHISLSSIQNDDFFDGEFSSLRQVTRKYSTSMLKLAFMVAEILAESIDRPREYFLENCNEKSCFLRLNRYPPCPFAPGILAFAPHTDSDFLTILSQDQVGGLHLMMNKQWTAVKPIPNALIINIGDLFQAWSNGLYKSVEHKVTTSRAVERYSTAFFLCPVYDSVIECKRKPRIYRSFTYGEYRRQVETDVCETGTKIGLPKFLI